MARKAGIDARGTTVSTMSCGAVGLGHPERLLAGLDELGRGGGREHVDVEGAEPGDQLGHLGGVGLQLLLAAGLEGDDQVGEGGVLDLLGQAEVEVRRPR